MSDSKNLPNMKPVMHIPYFDFADYLETRFNLETDEYWSIMTDSHMFRGNDTTMEFFYGFANDSLPRPLEGVLPSTFPPIVKDLLFDTKGIVQRTLLIDIDTLVEAHRCLCANKDTIRTALGKANEQYLEYLIGGTFEALVIKQYVLNDFAHSSGKYFFYITR